MNNLVNIIDNLIFVKLLPLAAYEGDDEVGFLVKAVSYKDATIMLLLIVIMLLLIIILYCVVAILGNCLFVQFPVLVQMVSYLSNNKQKDEQ